jgi:hypothetical protein
MKRASMGAMSFAGSIAGSSIVTFTGLSSSIAPSFSLGMGRLLSLDRVRARGRG